MEIFDTDLMESSSQAFLDYSAYNLQRRAIPDVRDGLRWSHRQILYEQNEAGLDFKHPFKKALKSVSAATATAYCHGDTSCYGMFIRMAKPFVYRATLQEAQGNYGTQIGPETHAASRYVELRGSELASFLLKDINKDTITEWEDTYDLEGQFPRVLPSKGFWNIVNGCQSIGSGMNCSIPCFNLKELNSKLEYLLLHPEAPAEDLVCLPDFPTGGIIVNKEEVKQSLINGCGSACKIRSNINYDPTTHTIYVTELPYQVYTNTICKQIAQLKADDPLCGIESVDDYTGKKVDLQIKISKNAKANEVIKMLYACTSLQDWYSINLAMLDKGLYPRIFGWKEAMQAHIDHEKIVYRKAYEYDLKSIERRIHILNGILICLASIEEVVNIIKSSPSTKEANGRLCTNFNLDEEQAAAVLAITLSRLANLEVQKIEREKDAKEQEAKNIRDILNNNDKFNQELINGWRYIAEKFGDERRTQIINFDEELEEQEPEEVKLLQVSITNKNNIFVSEATQLYAQRRGTVGKSIKLAKNECIINSVQVRSNSRALLFSSTGNCYPISAGVMPIDQLCSLYSLCKLGDEEAILTIAEVDSSKKFMVFCTQNGKIKKMPTAAFANLRKTTQVMGLEGGDKIISALNCDDIKVGILSLLGKLLIFDLSTVSPVDSRGGKGVNAIKLEASDCVVSAKYIKNNAKEIVSITSNGLAKRTLIKEFPSRKRATAGVQCQKLDTDDYMADFVPIDDAEELIIISTNTCLKVLTDTISLSGRDTTGARTIKLTDVQSVVSLN